jgi:capsular polysaccharide biosynthesis protein
VNKRTLLEATAVALVVAVLVLAVTSLRGEQYESRVAVLAVPAAQTDSAAQYGEVASLAMPAIVQLVHSPTVLEAAARASGSTPREIASGIGVELVPASGLARLSVRAGSADKASAAVTAAARAVGEANLLAPAGRLRVLDERPDTARVAPDWKLAIGFALAAALAAGIATAAVRTLRRPRTGEAAVRAAVAAAGVRHPVALVREDDPGMIDRLTALCVAAARPVRVIPAEPGLTAQAELLAESLPDKADEPGEGTAVIAVADGGGEPGDLAAALAVLPGSAVLVAVVLT